MFIHLSASALESGSAPPSSLFTAVVAATTAVVAATTAVVAATTAVVAATTARGDPRVCSWEGGTTEGFALNSKPHPDSYGPTSFRCEHHVLFADWWNAQ